MGTWLGHAAPGTFFIMFGMWWFIKSLHSYYSRPGQYTNSLLNLCCCKSRCSKKNLPVDGYIILLVAVLGVIMEIVTGAYGENGLAVHDQQHVTMYTGFGIVGLFTLLVHYEFNFIPKGLINNGVVPMGNQQHLTMYIGFGLTGLVSILIHHEIKFVPKGAEYMALLVALAIELVLFMFHLHNRADVDKHIHMLLVYTIGACMIAVGAEMVYPNNINAAIARSYCFLLQGTWFYQIAFTLYPPNGEPWDLKDMENIMVITLIFSWHMIGCLMACLILSGLTFWCCSPRCQGHFNHSEDGVQLLQSRHNSKKYNNNHQEDGGHHQTTAIMNSGYNSVCSDDEEVPMFTSPIRSGD